MVLGVAGVAELLAAAPQRLLEAGPNFTGVAILAFIVAVHEFGHFVAARAQGIRVQNFSIGFGPKVLSFTPSSSSSSRRGTEFSLRLLPFGGYVSFPEDSKRPARGGDSERASELDDDDDDDEDEDPNLLQNRPVRDRAIVVSGGVLANVILAWTALFTSVGVVGVAQPSYLPGVQVPQLADEAGPAARAGVQPGDIVLEVNGKRVESSADAARDVAARIRSAGNSPVELVVQHAAPRGRQPADAAPTAIRVEPRDGRIGVQLVPNARMQRVRPPAGDIVPATNREFARLWSGTWSGFRSLFTNLRESGQSLSGPVGVASVGAELAREDAAALFTFCAVISINLAIINALPLPALDGGQMAFLLIEAARGRRLPREVESAINGTALMILLVLSGALLVGDLEKLEVVKGVLRKLMMNG